MPESFEKRHSRPKESEGNEAVKPLSKEYFNIQLAFAVKVSGKTTQPLAQILFTHTNFFRRFGLGEPREESESNPEWQKYVMGLNAHRNIEELTDYTYSFYRASTPEVGPANMEVFGCFNFNLEDARHGVIVLHFANITRAHNSPFAKAEIEARRQELKRMFSYIRHTYPHVTTVKSGSWLHSLPTYRTLFPPEYNASQAPITPNNKFQGNSRWGQFLKYNGQVRPELEAQFLKNLESLDTENLADAFPLQTYQTEAPIQVFYDFYGITEEE